MNRPSSNKDERNTTMPAQCHTTNTTAMKSKGRHVIPQEKQTSKEYPKEKYYSVVNLDMEKFHNTKFGDISMNTFGDISEEKHPSRSSFSKEVTSPRGVKDLPPPPQLLMMKEATNLSLGNDHLEDDEAPMYFQNVAKNNYASSSEEEDDDDCYNDVLNDSRRQDPALQRQSSQRSLYLRQNSADLSEYEEQSTDGDEG